MTKERSIGGIGNYYGGLSVMAKDGKFWWSIENYSGHDWEEIPERLYDELTRFEEGGPAALSPDPGEGG